MGEGRGRGRGVEGGDGRGVVVGGWFLDVGDGGDGGRGVECAVGDDGAEMVGRGLLVL